MQTSSILVSLLFGLVLGSIEFARADSEPLDRAECRRDWVQLGIAPPQKLSEAGIFLDLNSLSLCSGVDPYWVNSPLWSDGSEKKRWIILSKGKSIEFSEEDPWRFPAGTVFIKYFAMNSVRLETRVSVIDSKGEWQGYSYRWNEDQKDAVLLADGQVREFGGGQRWTYPSRTMCLQCHNSWSGSVLGVRTEQLNQTIQEGGFIHNQLSAWAAKGYFSKSLPRSNSLKRYFNLHDPTVSNEMRVRSYLAVNCSHCHQPGTVIRSPIDFRFKTPLTETKTLNSPAYLGDLDLDDPVIIRPGDKSSSILWLRMSTNSTRHMPLIGSSVTDQEAVDLVGSWISELR